MSFNTSLLQYQYVALQIKGERMGMENRYLACLNQDHLMFVSLVDLERGWLVPAEPYPLQRQCPKRGLGPLKARGILVTN